MTSVAFTSLIAPHLQAGSLERDAQRITGFGNLLGAGVAPEAVSFRQIFDPLVLPAAKMPFHSDSAKAIVDAQSEDVDPAPEALLANPTMALPALAVPDAIDFEQGIASPILPTPKKLMHSDSADMMEGAQLEGMATPLQSMLVDPTEQVTVGAMEGQLARQSAQAVVADASKVLVGGSGNLSQMTRAAPSVDQVEVVGEAQVETRPSVLPLASRPNLDQQVTAVVAPNLLRPHLSSAAAQVAPLIGSTATALSAGADLELASSSIVSVNQVKIPMEVTQLVAFTSGPMGKVLPKQTAEQAVVESDSLAQRIMEKTGRVLTPAEPIVVTPQAPLEWYGRGINVDTLRATHSLSNQPVQQVVPTPLPVPEPLAIDVAASGKHRFAEAITAQIKSVDVTQERTHIALNPRGLGSIDIEISQSSDNTLKVTIRAENPVVLQALRDERSLLAQAIGFESGATLEFHQQARDGQGGTGRRDHGNNQELQAGDGKGEMSVKEKVEVIARNQLDITT